MPIAAGLVGALVGAVVVLAVIAIVWARARHRPKPPPEPVLTARHLALLIENLRTAAVVVSPDGRVLACSRAARAYRLVRGSVIAPPAVRGLLERVRTTGQPAELELDLPRGDDDATVTLGLRADTAPGGVTVLTGEDRSADLRFDKTRRDFTANTSHELKTPIGAIALLAEAIEASADDPATVRDFASRLGDETTRLTDLLAQIIELSRLQSDDPIPRSEPVSLGEVVATSIARCRERARRGGIELVVGACDPASVLGNAAQLDAALTNLVENAIAYSDAGSRVTVTVRRIPEDDAVELRVADHGIGIAAADQDRVFERFYRVDPARSRASGGTGLGLSIVKHTALAHGGDVSVWSKPGHGSTFTISLPEMEAMSR